MRIILGELLNAHYEGSTVKCTNMEQRFKSMLFPRAAAALEIPCVLYRAVRSQHGEIVREGQFMFYCADQDEVGLRDQYKRSTNPAQCQSMLIRIALLIDIELRSVPTF